MNDIKFYYSAGAMGRGNGRLWHSCFKFPDFPRITKTVTFHPRRGRPWAVAHLGHSIWNWQGLPNFGLVSWLQEEPKLKFPVILSIAGTDSEIEEMVNLVGMIYTTHIEVIELNFSCPNVEDHKNRKIPVSKFPLSLKLNCTQDPQNYDLSRIVKISVNSVPCKVGALSGKLAQKKNWEFIKNNIDLPISGASWRTMDDLNRLIDMGCKSIDIGTVLLTNPWMVQNEL